MHDLGEGGSLNFQCSCILCLNQFNVFHAVHYIHLNGIARVNQSFEYLKGIGVSLVPKFLLLKLVSNIALNYF